MASPHTPWLEILTTCLSELEREQAGSPSPVIDHEVVPVPGGNAGEARIWLICRTVAERRTFQDTEFARARASLQRKLLARHFPEEALATLTFAVTSRDEISQRGGSSFAFR